MTKPIKFEIFDLRLYIAIIENGSLSKAADSLPLALSAASARLKKLEERLGLTLLERHPRGIQPTNAGTLFYDHALRLMQAAQDTQKGMDALSGKGRIQLKIHSNTTGLSTNLPQQLGEFLQKNPSVDLNFEQSSSRQVLKSVAEGKADLGVVDGEYNQKDLLFLLYQRNELVVISNRDNPFAQKKSCSFEEWLKQPLVGYEKGSSLQQFLERMAVFAHLPAHFRATAPNFSAVAHLVANDVGVAIVSRPLALQFTKTLPLTLIKLDEPWANRELSICIRPQNDNQLPALKLARFLAGLK